MHAYRQLNGKTHALTTTSASGCWACVGNCRFELGLEVNKHLLCQILRYD